MNCPDCGAQLETKSGEIHGIACVISLCPKCNYSGCALDLTASIQPLFDAVIKKEAI